MSKKNDSLLHEVLLGGIFNPDDPEVAAWMVQHPQYPLEVRPHIPSGRTVVQGSAVGTKEFAEYAVTKLGATHIGG